MSVRGCRSQLVAPSRPVLVATVLVATVLVATAVLAVPAAAPAAADRWRAVTPRTGRTTLAARSLTRRPPLHGPAPIEGSFRRPTTPGDLLVAAVACGVRTGATVPPLTPPAGWHRAAATVGGIGDGLETAIDVRADNPGGLRTVTVGEVRRGREADCTVSLLELAGAGHLVGVDAAGGGSGDWQRHVTVGTSRPARPGDLVVAVTSDGTTVADNRYRVAGLAPVLEEHDSRTYQPGVVAIGTARGGRPLATVAWSGGLADNCGSIAALRLGG